MTPPTYLDGAPANLEAAALDALAWLRWAKSPIRTEENEQRLDESIRALEKFLPNADLVFLDSVADATNEGL